MQPQARGRPGRATLAAASVAAALALATLLLLARQRLHASPAGTADEPKSHHDSVYAPDVPGAEAARQWLLSYYGERQRRGPEPRWPAAAALPTLRGCEAGGGMPSAEAQKAVRQVHRKQQAGRQAEPETLEKHRHLVLAAVGDSWSPGADANRRVAGGCA